MAVYLRVGAPQKVYEGIPKKIRADGVYCRNYKAAPESEACGVPCPVHVFVAQCPGNYACAAYAEEIGYSGKEHEGGHAYRHGSNHGVAAGEANEEGIRHVVYHKYYLAHYRRHGKGKYGLCHWRLFKKMLFSFKTVHAALLLYQGKTLKTEFVFTSGP